MANKNPIIKNEARSVDLHEYFKKAGSPEEISKGLVTINNKFGMIQFLKLYPNISFELFIQIEPILTIYFDRYLNSKTRRVPGSNYFFIPLDSPIFSILNKITEPLNQLNKSTPDCFIVRKAGWETLYGGENTQDSYGAFQSQTVLLATLGCIIFNWEYETLFYFCACRRAEIAVINKHEPISPLGILPLQGQYSSSASRTSLFGPYESVGNFFIKYCSNNENIGKVSRFPFMDGFIEVDIQRNIPFSYSNGPLGRVSMETASKDYVMIKRSFVSNDNKVYPLDDIIINFDPDHCALGFPEKRSSANLFHKVPCSYLKELGEQLFRGCVHLNGEEFIQGVAKYFWWMCIIKPWCLGDPSILETMFKTLCEIKGYTIPAWKIDLIPWVEVVRSLDPNQYAKDFSSFFAEVIKYPSNDKKIGLFHGNNNSSNVVQQSEVNLSNNPQPMGADSKGTVTSSL